MARLADSRLLAATAAKLAAKHVKKEARLVAYRNAARDHFSLFESVQKSGKELVVQYVVGRRS